MAPARSPELVEQLAAAGRHRAGDGRRAADLAGPVDGRAVVDGQRRGLPRGDRGRPRVRPPVHRPGDRGRQGAHRPGCSWWAPASPGWRRSGPRARWAPSCVPSTCAPRSPSRSSRWAPQFVTVDMEQEVSSDGYAKEMTDAQQEATAAMYDEEARAADIIITTALIPGRPAPLLVTEETVAGMKHRHRWSSTWPRPTAATSPSPQADAEGRHRQRGDDPRLHRPRQPAARPDLAALRHQHRQPVQAPHPRAGRAARPSTWTTSSSAGSPSSRTASRCGRRRRCRSRPTKGPRGRPRRRARRTRPWSPPARRPQAQAAGPAAGWPCRRSPRPSSSRP